MSKRNKMIYKPTNLYFRSSVESVIETIAHLQFKEAWLVNNMRNAVSPNRCNGLATMKNVVIDGDTKT